MFTWCKVIDRRFTLSQIFHEPNRRNMNCTFIYLWVFLSLSFCLSK